MSAKLDVQVGDEVTVVDRDGPLKIVRVEHVTQSGMIDANGERWNAGGSSRAKVSAWQISRIETTTDKHRDRLRRSGLAYKCVKAFDAIGTVHSSEVARMNADDINEATELIEKLAPLLAKRKQ